jgi:hypothetical protein
VSEWQPIETAPKGRKGDTVILGWSYETAYWGLPMYWHRGRWRDVCGKARVHHPTHWMPLPEPPE